MLLFLHPFIKKNKVSTTFSIKDRKIIVQKQRGIKKSGMK
jgi:hypothetical protein